DDDDDDDDDDEHEHEHEHEHHHHHDHEHHHHHHDEGEAEEYGIGTFVYYARRPLNLSLFDEFVARKWPKNIIRAKGICYFKDEADICYVFEQAGRQVSLRNAGQWYATMPKDELANMMAMNPQLRKDWDDQYGDRMQKLVFIGQHLDKEQITKDLDFCLA
ncbi:MAG: GTP-binding protein, partial [Prevotella sp.]|nr:GTP-binding protein [Prevotella sp.]